MPKIIPKLTDTQVRNAKPKAKDYKLYDEGGLRLLVRPTGTKVWQYPYTLNGKANVYTIGKYDPTGRVGYIGLADARTLRDEVRQLVKQGTDPNNHKKIARIGEHENNFEAIAREWHGKQLWVKKHASNILRTLEMDVFPRIGHKQIQDVTAQDIIGILREIENRDALDVAKRINQRCTAIFDYALTLGLCENNPATGRAKFIQVRKVKHRPHLREGQLPEFLEKLENYRGGSIPRLAMKFLTLTFVRPGELRNARWDEIDEIKAEWRIPAERMKMKRPHIVPLSKQALEVLKELKNHTGKSPLLFPGVRDINKPISDVTLTKLLIILGYIGENKFVPHGIRATASTILNEKGQFKPDVIERQLAHIEKNKVRAAYHHAEYLEDRKAMMQWWGSFIDSYGAEI